MYRLLLTTTAIFLITYPQARAEITGSGSCGENCIFEYDDNTITYRPIDQSKDAILSINSGFGTDRAVVNVAEGITEIRQNGGIAPLNGWNASTGKLILPSSLKKIGAVGTHQMTYSVIEINSKELTLENNSFNLLSDKATIIINPDINITGSFSNTYDHYPKDLTILCKGAKTTCQNKMDSALEWVKEKNGGKVSYDYYKGLNSDGHYEEWSDNGKVVYTDSTKQRVLSSQGIDGSSTVYDFGGNVVAQYDKNGKQVYAKKIYTPAEAAAATHDGNDNVVSITW